VSNFVMHFNEIDRSSLRYVGGKGANLGEMTKAGFPIPTGFCITTTAYHMFIETSEEMEHFLHLLDQVHPEEIGKIQTLGKRIREHLQSLAMPGTIKKSILESWRKMGSDDAYAVRSSATAEDLPTASFAGQQETYLNVRGEEQLLEAIQKCWASLFTDRAISYRAKNGFGHRSVSLSVVVQQMVFPEVSGIMFTADPITGNRNTISIDASFGLGEALVSGLISADLYQVRAGNIVNKQVSKKKIAIYSLPEGGTITKELPESMQLQQALSDEHIITLADLGKRIEDHYGTEQDIEWCMVGDEFFIVQSRPITSLYPKPPVMDEKLHVFLSFGHPQMMTNAMKPVSLSVWRTMFPFGKASVRAESKAMLPIGSRLYIDPTAVLYLKPAQKILPKVLSGVDEQISSAIAEVIEREEFQHQAVPNPQVRRLAIRFVRPILLKTIKNIFFGQTSHALRYVEDFMEKTVEKSRMQIGSSQGAARIVRIQENAGQLLRSLFQNILPFPLSGVITGKLMQVLATKWLGSTTEVSILNRSLAGNVTSEMGLLLGDLADIARNDQNIVNSLQSESTKIPYDQLLAATNNTTFKHEWDRFIEKYGMRCPGEIDITTPRWREAPEILIASLLSHIRSVAPGEHRKKHEQGEKEAEKAAEELLRRIKNTRLGSFKAKLMARLIKVYRDTMGLREHPKYIMIRHLDMYKQAILEEGCSLFRKGIIEREEDVFYLSLEEMVLLIEDRFMCNVKELIELRKKEYELHEKLTPPRVITSEGEVITGRRRNIQAPEGALIGTPVSPGIVEGYAKVVLKPEKATLNRGEIMIAPFTDPGWTPLFNSAIGLVMETGGMMTHGAVVAREYGIPAVVGINRATELIKDGDYIRLDGTQGYVQKVETKQGE
jgi:phosphoenolpyruvate synthase/pyruvate phosphate dikinase